MNKEQLFDQHISNSLNNLDLKIPDQAWNAFSEHLNKTNLERALVFDRAIAAALPVTPPADPQGQWELFSEALRKHNTAQAEDFDKAIRNKLANATSGPAPLEIPATAHRIRSLRLAKGAEAAAVLLLLLVAWSLIPALTGYNKGDLVTLSQPEFVQKTPATDPAQMTTTSSGSAMADQRTDNLPITAGDPLNKHTPTRPAHLKGMAIYGIAELSSDLPASGDNRPIAFSQEQKAFVPIADPENTKSPTSVMSPDHNPAALPLVYAHLDMLPLPDLNGLTSSPAAIDQQAVQSLEHAFQLPVLAMKGGFISKVLIGLKLGPVFDKITTPLSTFGKRDIISREVNNSLFGFDIELQNKWVNVEAGVTYSFKKYGLQDLNDAKGHFISIPVSLKKTFMKNNRISPFVKIGPDFNIVLASEVRPESANRNQINSLDQYAPSENFVAKSKIDDGVLSSGSITENSYFGVHAGLGLEAKINAQSGLVLEVNQQFNPFQKELGINNQKFSQTSVTVGFKKLLHYNNIY